MTLATFPRLAAALLLGAAMLAPSPADAGRRDHRYEHRYEHRDWDDRDYRHGYRDGRRDQRRWERYDDRRDWRRDHRGRVVYREVYPVPDTPGYRFRLRGEEFAKFLAESAKFG